MLFDGMITGLLICILVVQIFILQAVEKPQSVPRKVRRAMKKADSEQLKKAQEELDFINDFEVEI